MLVIRKAQLETLEEYSLASFVQRMAKQLRSSCAAETRDISEPDLRQMISAGVERAEQFGIEDEADVERFLDYTLRFGPEFGNTSQTTWAGEILQDDGMDGSEKMNRINDYDLFVLGLGSDEPVQES